MPRFSLLSSHRWFVVLLAACVVLLARPASAVDEATRAALRDLGTEGVHAYQAGDYATARQKLDEAFSIMRTAPLALWSARALEKSGLLVQASERYLAAERAPVDPEGDQQAQIDARATAREERAALQPRIPRLTVRIEGVPAAEATLVVDGRDVPAALVGKSLPVNPGTVEVIATSGDAKTSGRVDIAEGENKDLLLTLRPSAPSTAAAEGPQPDDASTTSERSLVARKWPAFVAAGVAVAGGIVWTVFGVQSMDAKSQADACTAATCTSERVDELRQQAWDAGNVATVGMVLTGVGVVGAGVLWFTLPGASKTSETARREPAFDVGPLAQVELGVRPGGIQLRGRF